MYSDNTSQSDLEDERAKLRTPPDKQTRPDESDCSKGGGRLKKSPLPYPANHAAQEKSLVVPKRKSLNDDMQTSLEQAKMKTLTVSEVCEWLDTLKLSKYKASFMENMIDGLLLTELSEDMMRDELGMNRFEALKLKKFAKEGHIPKI
ncbi:hypothetical protein FSP39_020498 [Pinctada imbricata]|uniref:SAM domain-containing protein n=1 Tax=Pinctada imbricata TaxID=66713 RepID=A0AA88YEB7_PINIB|nr:hypothetical protein FSP39_020498 [Pinctada imbricata]